MTPAAERLLQLLPSLYRLRDAAGDGALARLVEILAHPMEVLQEDLAQLYDDQFIETCADWAVPYLGDLIGWRQLNGVTPALSSPRAEVANTVHLRRAKGTVAVLEGLARDVTGWDARAVEFFQLLAVTQCLKHVRAGAGGTPDLRRGDLLRSLGGGFDSVARTAEARSFAAGGRYDIPRVGIVLWRAASVGLTRASAFKLDDTRWLFDPLGIDRPLLRRPQPSAPDAARVAPEQLPLPITRRELADAVPDFSGPDASFFIEGLAADAAIVAADLGDLDATGQAWAHMPPANTIYVDPERGRIALPAATAQPLVVRAHRASVIDLGGGEYERQLTFDLALAPVVAVDPGDSLQAALTQVAAGGALEVRQSLTHVETPAIALAAAAVVEWRASDQCRPVVALGGELAISGGDGSELTLNGLVLTGAGLRVSAAADGGTLRRLRLVHCTLVPGLAMSPDGTPRQPGTPSLVVETAGTAVELDHCIVGALRIAPLASLSLTACIVDAGDPAAIALAAPDGQGPAAPTRADASTVVGRLHVQALPLVSNSLLHARAPVLADVAPWPAPVWSERRQDGALRFSYVPPSSLVPRRYRCQPASAADAVRMVPMFDSPRYADAAYLRLARRAAPELRTGADDGGEMGVHHETMTPQRERNLRLRLDEYLRVGLEGGLLFAD